MLDLSATSRAMTQVFAHNDSLFWRERSVELRCEPPRALPGRHSKTWKVVCQCQIMADQRRQTNWAEESWIKPHEKATATGVHRLRADEKAKIVYYVHSQTAERTRPLTMDLDTGLLLHDLQAVEKSAAMDLG